MKFILLALGLLVTAPPARADILFFDLNFSPKEVEAAEAAAKQRGERLRLYPARSSTQQKQIDRAYRESLSIQNQFTQCSRKPGANCTAIAKKLSESQGRLDALTAELKAVDAQELERIAAALEAERASISAIVFSGHSGGTGSFVGILGHLDLDAIRASLAARPALIENTRSILLWGCYGGTFHSLQVLWRQAFPRVESFVGYEGQSPLGIRDTSGRFMKSYLAQEKRLLAAKELKGAHQIFRGVDLVAPLDGTALVRDWYLTYDLALSAGEMVRRCQSFRPELYDQFLCYENGKAGCENPPADHRGPLRELYSFLQVNRHCSAVLRERYPQLPTPDYLVRLIFLDHVKQNFVAHHGDKFSVVDSDLKDAGLAPELGFTKLAEETRAKNVAQFRDLDASLGSSDLKDAIFEGRAGWQPSLLVREAMAAAKTILGPSHYLSVPMEHCVPFSWVEPKAKEADRCGLGPALHRPVDDSRRESLLSFFFEVRMSVYVWEHDPGFDLASGKNAAQLKGSYEKQLSGLLAQMELMPPSDPREMERKEKYRQLLKAAEAQSTEKFAAAFLSRLDAFAAYLHELRAKLDKLSYGSQAMERISYREGRIQEQRKALEVGSSD